MGPLWPPPPGQEPLGVRVKRLIKSRALLITAAIIVGLIGVHLHNYLVVLQISSGSEVREFKAIWLSEVRWSMEKPQRYTYFNKVINNTLTNYALYLALCIRVKDFCPGTNSLSLDLIANTSVSEGTVLSIILRYTHPVDSRLLLMIPSTKGKKTLREVLEETCLRNLRLVAHGARKNATHLTTYFTCAPRGPGPTWYGITMSVEWWLPDEVDSGLSVVLELQWADPEGNYRMCVSILIDVVS